MLNRRFFLAFFSILIVLLVSLFSIRQTSKPEFSSSSKIYECLEVGSDLECLKAHIAKQFDVIDQFIVLESLVNFKGESKTLLYEAHKEEFKDFNDKITYLVTSDFPECKQPLIKEFHLKNQYLKALDNCQDDDIILFSQSDLTVNIKDLHKGMVWLERHPEEIIKLKAHNLVNKSSNQDVKAATFAHVKEMLPASIEKSTKLKAQKIRWKSIFSPV